MRASNTLANWRMKVFLWVGLPVVAVVGLVFSSADVIPAWQAKTGNGIPGSFTATREDCGRRSCSFYGNWTATDGNTTRTDVILYDEPDSLQVGGTTDAIDSGGRKGVFATAGGYTYLLVTGLALAGVAAAVALIVILLRAFRRRKIATEGPTDRYPHQSMGR